ncbi:geranylgeranyl diphosphate reductase [Salinarimonas soli]|uniref:Geranylgeranyl diphosphate reductase n=1 Tax=Salinarimonas soli TaxID=1638099 RepID=A0A5B2VEV8_9HYPH|nr:geranylgeranyl diphosphate reductase [Salinarimonas soli]KAA2238093.1 geranylgeranyl diphosphate reductase [Salinarimonas soli]
MTNADIFDVVVVGGGPAGATAAADLAKRGRRVALLDRAGRIKPCGGAIPPRLIRDFAIPDELIVAKARGARMVAPSGGEVDMPIDGFVGMVDREHFDEWLRARAASTGAERRTGTLIDLAAEGEGYRLTYRAEGGETAELRTRTVVGADGANSGVARAAMPKAGRVPFVFAYHEIVRSPPPGEGSFDPARCDVYYQGRLSPDFYAWIFPHGETTSIGTGSAHKGFSLKGSVADLRRTVGLEGAETIRREGAPIPLRPLRRWDDGRGVLLVGDAAGVVAPSSGEGIYYAMASARLGADAVEAFLATGDARALREARRDFMRAHGRVFWILGLMQRIWYRNDWLRERFVSLCRDPDIQRLTWDAYMNKELVRASPLVHARIALKDLAHLLGLAGPWGRRA